jgi:cytochrome c-type protein NapB
MKIFNKFTIGLFTATLLLTGCNESATPKKSETVKPTISEESLGLRKTDLFTEGKKTQGHEAHYSTTYAGSGHKIKRAFQDAPPMIPHSTDGMLPITIKNNQCLSCHMPDVASMMGATPIPVSHFIDFRPAKSLALENKNTSSETLANVTIKKTKKLYGGRYNCTQCHAPQSGDDEAVKNTFQPDYTSPNGASRSSWNGTKLTEGLNTYKSSK